ncbi:MAG: hypothetical protein COB50_04220 [Thiotrichales bacterium]|nr:MAG: hypothetical protein COB50_04220 [Thiotrichales bacterium]
MDITIEETLLITKQSKAGKPYSIQKAYVHLVNNDGSPKRYPEEISIFPSRDKDGNPIPYQKGEYYLDDTSFVVERGFLQLNFVNISKKNK